ncbi:hypothetical protein D3C78_1722140 [compost metagenome]
MNYSVGIGCRTAFGSKGVERCRVLDDVRGFCAHASVVARRSVTEIPGIVFDGDRTKQKIPDSLATTLTPAYPGE